MAAQVASYEDCPYVGWLHRDCDHEHLHLLQAVITWDGNVVSDSHNYHRSKAVCRELEQEFGLAVMPKLGESGAKHSEHDFIRAAIQEAVATVPEGGLTLAELLKRLLDEGIEVQIPKTRTGKVKGIKYRFDEAGEWISGTDLGREYTYPGLANHLQVQLPDADKVPVPPQVSQSAPPVELPEPPKPRLRRQRNYRRLEQEVLKRLAEQADGTDTAATVRL